jgi:hypothetical protein
MGTPSPPGSACRSERTELPKMEAYANRTRASPLAGRDTVTPTPCLRSRTSANTYRPPNCVTVARPVDRHPARPLASPRSDTLPCRRCQSLRLRCRAVVLHAASAAAARLLGCDAVVVSCARVAAAHRRAGCGRRLRPLPRRVHAVAAACRYVGVRARTSAARGPSPCSVGAPAGGGGVADAVTAGRRGGVPAKCCG